MRRSPLSYFERNRWRRRRSSLKPAWTTTRALTRTTQFEHGLDGGGVHRPERQDRERQSRCAHQDVRNPARTRGADARRPDREAACRSTENCPKLDRRKDYSPRDALYVPPRQSRCPRTWTIWSTSRTARRRASAARISPSLYQRQRLHRQGTHRRYF